MPTFLGECEHLSFNKCPIIHLDPNLVLTWHDMKRITLQWEVDNKENLPMQKRELKLFFLNCFRKGFQSLKEIPTSNNKQLFKEFIHFLYISWWWWKPWLCCSLWFSTAILCLDSMKNTLVLKPATENFLQFSTKSFVTIYLYLYMISCSESVVINNFLYKNRSFRRSWASAEQLLIQPSVCVLVINIFHRPPVLFTKYCRRKVHLFREGALIQYFLYTVIYTECRSTEHLLCWTEAQTPWLNKHLRTLRAQLQSL